MRSRGVSPGYGAEPPLEGGSSSRYTRRKAANTSFVSSFIYLLCFFQSLYIVYTFLLASQTSHVEIDKLRAKVEKLTEEISKGKVNEEVEDYHKDLLDICEQKLSRALDSDETWLVLGIPTIHRSENSIPLDYLTKTLDALLLQFPISEDDPLWGKIKIVVVNNSNERHVVFEQNRDRLRHNEHFLFIENEEAMQIERSKKKDPSTNKPRERVRRQTLDVVGMLRIVKKVVNPTNFIFMEDDFQLCAHGFDALRYLINKSTLYHGDWIAIRASFGLNGVIVKGQDLDIIADYLEKNVVRRPPDHLIVEWFAGETNESKNIKRDRVNIGFRYNLWRHIGTSSSIRKTKTKQDNFPICWEPLVYPVAFEVEAFDPETCPDDDIWPCNSQSSQILKSQGHPTRINFDSLYSKLW